MTKSRAGVTPISAAVSAAARGTERASVELGLTLGAHRLTGAVGGVYGTTLIAASYSTLAPKHLIAGWVRLLALLAHGRDADAVVIGRHNKGGKRGRVERAAGSGRAAGRAARPPGARDCATRCRWRPETSYTYAKRRRSQQLRRRPRLRRRDVDVDEQRGVSIQQGERRAVDPLRLRAGRAVLGVVGPARTAGGTVVRRRSAEPLRPVGASRLRPADRPRTDSDAAMTAVPAQATFAMTGPLPTGTTVIEASAGTGKTYTIVGLATRYVAEQDIPPGRADAGHLRPGGDPRAARARPGAVHATALRRCPTRPPPAARTTR